MPHRPIVLTFDGVTYAALPGPVASWIGRRLERALAADLQQAAARDGGGSMPSDVRVAVACLNAAARQHFVSVATSVDGSPPASGGDASPSWPSEQVGVPEAATLIGCGERNVRDLTIRGRLRAVSRRPILLDRAEVLAYAASRRSEETTQR